MRRGLRWLGRNALYLLSLAACGNAAALVLAGHHMPWWAQLAWIGIAAVWAVNAWLRQATIRMQQQQLKLGQRPISCAMSGCPVRLNGHGAGRFERLAHDLWMWSPGS